MLGPKAFTQIGAIVDANDLTLVAQPSVEVLSSGQTLLNAALQILPIG
jgi:hypothetical protein